MQHIYTDIGQMYSSSLKAGFLFSFLPGLYEVPTLRDYLSILN